MEKYRLTFSHLYIEGSVIKEIEPSWQVDFLISSLEDSMYHTPEFILQSLYETLKNALSKEKEDGIQVDINRKSK